MFKKNEILFPNFLSLVKSVTLAFRAKVEDSWLDAFVQILGGRGNC